MDSAASGMVSPAVTFMGANPSWWDETPLKWSDARPHSGPRQISESHQSQIWSCRTSCLTQKRGRQRFEIAAVSVRDTSDQTCRCCANAGQTFLGGTGMARRMSNSEQRGCSHYCISGQKESTRRRMARERKGAESSVVSMETLYYKTIY